MEELEKRPLNGSSSAKHTANMAYRMVIGSAVLTNGHTGHVPRARDFFLFEGPPTGCVEINFLKLIILSLPLMKPSSG